MGIIILALAGAPGVPYNPILFLTVIGELLLLSFTMITYAVYPLREAVFSHLSLSVAASAQLSPDVAWDGWAVPVVLSLGIVAIMGAALLRLGDRGVPAHRVRCGHTAFQVNHAMALK